MGSPSGPTPPPHQPPNPQQQQQQTPGQPELSVTKLTRGTSCVLCRQRKVRCDRQQPCSGCVKAGAQCRVLPPRPPKRRKRRLQEKDLVERLRKYETILAQHGIKFDAIDDDLKTGPQGHNPDDVDELESDFEGLRTSPEASVSPSATAHADKHSRAWFSFNKEFRANEQMLHDSSDEDDVGPSTLPTIHRAFDKIFANQGGFPFAIGVLTAPVTAYHPSAIHILRLWQTYLDNVNPLLKITHAPSIQGQIIEATSRLDQAPKNIEALMFGVYAISITSMEEVEVQKTFNSSKQELLGRYFAAVQQALINASFMRSGDLITLQAFILYLFAVRMSMDPRQLFCLIGIAVRAAQQMGLHRDPAGYGLPPLEVEMRRRLWWTIVGYDRRIGEMTGATVTALASTCDCKIPLNVNDSDLHANGKEPPTPHARPTEMVFALPRIEISMAIVGNGGFDMLSKMSRTSPAGKSGDITRLIGQDSPSYTLEGFSAHIEATYLSHCDSRIPLHSFTLIMIRAALCKMRVIDFLVRRHNKDCSLKESDRESHFLYSIQMIEYDNLVQSTESLRHFRWLSHQYFPFPAYMFLIPELRHRVSGPMVDRAWKVIELNHNHRELMRNVYSPIHMALGNLFVKAWAAYEDAQRAAGTEVSTPHFVHVLRERAEMRRRTRLENRANPSLGQDSTSFPWPRAGGFAPTSPENAAMMASPVDPMAAGVGGAQLAMTAASSISGEDSEMDWGYMMAGYQNVGAFPGFNAFGGFGEMGGFNDVVHEYMFGN